MTHPLADCLPEMMRLGLLDAPDEAEFTPLTGGVASDIWRVQTPARVFVIKRALAKLRVAADWRVPVERNAFEVAWLNFARSVAPGVAPEVLAHSTGFGFFAMDYLPAQSHPVWKQELRAGRADPAFAGRVGAALGAIHARAANRPEMAASFNSDALFRAIRVEPYLEYTASRHPALAGPLNGLAGRTLSTHVTLAHGDVSPKNILVGPAGPVFLDAECAWYGDPAFDLAFCLNHLLLKCLWTPQTAPGFLASFDALSRSYLACVDWEPAPELERRAAALLPALLLARIDGKSPVEYLTADAVRQGVRDFAIPRVERAPRELDEIRAAWARAAPGMEA